MMVLCPAQPVPSDFWSLETIGIDINNEHLEDAEKATLLFNHSVTRLADGSYQVSFFVED